MSIFILKEEKEERKGEKEAEGKKEEEKREKEKKEGKDRGGNYRKSVTALITSALTLHYPRMA